ncbi:transposase [Marinilabilia salmonicolor]|uniref:REP element-mobilizing transposase RayT n=1 Tax=Marinilabilia salmonicolor TaxID=989 RepID=A0A368UX60_9BACT|nr:transposase [Marinilabilia salmonicolor]RCW33319.1 REP element-mobilizing transposase RayT [Marinilabilia salmonicolor]
MKTNYPNRKSIRLKGYDYSQPGRYFITLCTQNRECLFGDIQNGKLILNDAGEMVNHWYYELENKFPDIKCHAMVVMPNHFHCIIEIVGETGEHGGLGEHGGSPLRAVVQWFKTMTTNEYIRGVKNGKFPRFDRRVWQRNYWEHIVRNENEYMRISQYIIDNPRKWINDKLNNGDGNIVLENQSPYNEEPWMI